MPDSIFASASSEIGGMLSECVRGRVTSIQGLTVSAVGLPVPIGAHCAIETRRDGVIEAEVIGLQRDRTLLSAFRESTGIAPGDWIECRSGAPRVAVGMDLLGRVIDARGRPLDGRPAARLNRRMPLYADAPSAMSRRRIETPLGLGVRAIDALLTAGQGQRLGIFAGTGVGKSVLMGMICRNTQADVNVVALVGERGREVREFVENQLGAEGLRRSVVVVCTSDEAPPLRVRACFQATAIAEFFRDQGLNVLLMMDSLTRMAMAQRQIGLAAGEPPTAKGYPPSAFALLPRLLERAGRTQSGSITGIYTVLVEGGDVDEPLSDAVRGILDGHIWLSRNLANRGHFPAVDALNSISRVADDVVDEGHRKAAREVRKVLAIWNDIEDLVSIGAYVAGANVDYDVAVRTREMVTGFLQQDCREQCDFLMSDRLLRQLGELIEKTREQLAVASRRA
jgi:flagellum-specific ATP synthase